MKAIRTYLIGLMMLIGTSAFAQPMNYNAMRNNARFLTDRMAYTLGITSLDLIDDLYRINFDYIYSINDYLDDIALGYRYDDYMSICAERDFALRMLLGDLLWNRIVGYDYFYRPILFENHRWRFHIYSYDYNIHHYYCHIPTHFDHYHGGHYITHMHPHRGIGERGPGMARWDNHRSTMVRGGERGGMTRGDRTSVNRGGDRGGVTRGDRSSYNRGGDRGSVTRGDRSEGMRGGERPEGGRGGDRPSVTPGNERPNANMGERPTERPSATPSRGSESRTQGNMQSSSRGSYGGSTRSSSSGSYGGSTRSSSSGSFGGSTRSSSSGSSGGSRGGSFGGGSRGGSTGGGMSRGGRR